MGKVASMACTFCNIQTETITHLFYDCIRVRCLWLFLEKVIYKIVSSSVKLECQDVILGYSLDNKDCLKYKDVNNIILIAKNYIWNCRKHRDTISVRGLQRAITNYKQYDKSLENLCNRLSLANIDWLSVIRSDNKSNEPESNIQNNNTSDQS